MGVRKYASDDDKPYSSNCQCLTRGEWRALKEAFGNRCAYCRRADRSLIPEHMLPVARGGEDVAENVVPSCRPCNSSKQDLTLLEWVMVQLGPCDRVPMRQRYGKDGHAGAYITSRATDASDRVSERDGGCGLCSYSFRHGLRAICAACSRGLK